MNNRFYKNIKGNITILVLMISMVAIMAMTMLAAYVQREIGFTNIDQEKQVALNLAEAGVSDLFYDIERYHNDEISSLPTSPITETVQDSGGESLGSYSVEYEEVYDSEDRLTDYIITSTGTTLDGTERSVLMNLSVTFSTEVIIYDFIYTKGNMTYDGIFDRVIEGPFFTAGDLNLRALSSIGGPFASGEILIGGNLDIGEFSSLDTGPISVAGDVEMDGFYATMDHNFDEPLVVMGDIRIEGGTSIGTATNPVNLALSDDSVVAVNSPAHLYYDPPISYDERFDPPSLDVASYVSNFMTQLEGPPTTGMEVDESVDGTADGILHLDSSLIPLGETYFEQIDGDNTFRFEEYGDDYILTIAGNIIVDGDVIFGEDIAESSQYIIHYDGVGKIICTGSMHTYCRIYPYAPGSFPESDFLIIMAQNNIDLEVVDYRNYFGSCAQPDLYLMAIAGDTLKLYRHISLKGSVMCNHLDTSDGWLSSWAKICYQDGISDNLPEDLPQLIYGGAEFEKEWQEILN